MEKEARFMEKEARFMEKEGLEKEARFMEKEALEKEVLNGVIFSKEATDAGKGQNICIKGIIGNT